MNTRAVLRSLRELHVLIWTYFIASFVATVIAVVWTVPVMPSSVFAGLHLVALLGFGVAVRTHCDTMYLYNNLGNSGNLSDTVNRTLASMTSRLDFKVISYPPSTPVQGFRAERVLGKRYLIVPFTIPERYRRSGVTSTRDAGHAMRAEIAHEVGHLETPGIFTVTLGFLLLRWYTFLYLCAILLGCCVNGFHVTEILYCLLLVFLLQGAEAQVSQKYEYIADLRGALLIDDIQATIESFEQYSGSSQTKPPAPHFRGRIAAWWDSWFLSTHPPTRKRIELLRACS